MTRNSDDANKEKAYSKGVMRPFLAVKDGEWFGLVFNVWFGYVAAGSYDVGFKVDPYYKVLKQSLSFHPKYNPRKAGLLMFEGNVGHSNKRGVYMLSLENDKFADTNMTALVNVKSFRNILDGIKFYGSRYLGIRNGLLADNR